MGVSAAFFPKFKKVMALLASDRDGERQTAANQAYRMCQDNDLSILEALEGAFGNSNEDDLRQEISDLEEDNRKLAEAVSVLNAQHQAVPGDAGQQLLNKAWSYAKVRLLAVYVGALFSFWMVNGLYQWAAGGNRFMAFVAPCMKWLCVLDILGLVWSWACAEFSESGLGVVALKGIVVLGSLFLVVTVFGADEDVLRPAIMLLLASVLTVTNICPSAVDELAHSEEEAFRVLRSWFGSKERTQ